MEPRIIETGVFSAAGCVLILIGLLLRAKISKTRLFAFIYAGVLFLLSAFATFFRWINFADPQFGKPYDIWRFGGGCFFVYLAIVQRRKNPKSKAWLLCLIAGIGLALLAIFHI
jgi:hypothetical membrane protein